MHCAGGVFACILYMRLSCWGGHAPVCGPRGRLCGAGVVWLLSVGSAWCPRSHITCSVGAAARNFRDAVDCVRNRVVG